MELSIPTFYPSIHQEKGKEPWWAALNNDGHLVFDVFLRQDRAFARFDLYAMHQYRICKAFSYESIHEGKRNFVVADFQNFVEHYFTIPLRQRHCYELIRETFPCRAYFDLEYNIPANPEVDGDKLTNMWIELVLWKIAERYDIHLEWKNVVVLDSCTPTKFSKHVSILAIQWDPCLNKETEYLFPDNVSVGSLVQDILLSITSPIAPETVIDPSMIVINIAGQRRVPLIEYEPLWVNPEASISHDNVGFDSTTATRSNVKKVLFIDCGVYSRNRAFRLYGSCKFGKEKVLGLDANDAKRYFNVNIQSSGGNASACRLKLFQSSLIIPHDLLVIDQAAIPFEYKMKRNNRNVRNNTLNTVVESSEESYAPFSSFISYFNHEKYRILPHFDGQQQCTASSHSIRSTIHGNSITSSSEKMDSLRWHHSCICRSKHARQPSWFPLLDNFVLKMYANREVITVDGRDGHNRQTGYISSWLLYETPPKGGLIHYRLRYQIGGNRYCEAINRPHKSNGIFVDVDLLGQEIKQGCWDIDCRNYPFIVHTLPLGVLPPPQEVIEMVRKFVNSNKVDDGNNMIT